MDISNHLSTLLKFNECVVIPDFGSFLTNYVPSQFDPERNAYLPPAKEVVFNPKITKNDGLLINHLVEAESITYSQAYQAVTNWVSNAFEMLDGGEKLEMNGIGTIELDHSGSFVFTSSLTNLLADSYGLGPVNFPRLVRPVISSYRQRQAVRVISNRKNAIRIAAGIALVLSLSLFPMKIKKDNFKFDVSNLNPFTTLTAPETEQPKETVVNNTPTEEKVEVVTEQKNAFVLVGGCFTLEENANDYYGKLLKEGNHAEVVKLQNGRYRVIVDSYKTREEAMSAMNNYRDNHPGSQVWVSTR